MSSGFSIRDIIKSYKSEKMHEELAGEWAAVVLYRWLSFFLTPMFLRTSISATGVTLISVLITLTLPVAVILPRPFDYLFIGIISIIFNILDCVDGNIARMTGNITNLGQYSDFIADVIHRILLYITLGLIINSATVNDSYIFHPFVIASVSSLLAVTGRLSRIYFESKFFMIESLPEKNIISGQFKKAENIVFSFISGIDSLLPVFIIVGGYFNKLSYVLLWVFLYSCLDFFYSQIRIIRNLR